LAAGCCVLVALRRPFDCYVARERLRGGANSSEFMEIFHILREVGHEIKGLADDFMDEGNPNKRKR
jgi:hypothetical protein